MIIRIIYATIAIIPTSYNNDDSNDHYHDDYEQDQEIIIIIMMMIQSNKNQTTRLCPESPSSPHKNERENIISSRRSPKCHRYLEKSISLTLHHLITPGCRMERR